MNCIFCKRELTNDPRNEGKGYVLDPLDQRICDNCSAVKRARECARTLIGQLAEHRKKAKTKPQPLEYLEAKLNILKIWGKGVHVNSELYAENSYWDTIFNKELDKIMDKHLTLDDSPDIKENTNY